ncbi:MAG: hypothetical protein ABI808_00545 [Pseudonocardiales bacterium]
MVRLGDLVERWVTEPSERAYVEDAMTGLARGVVLDESEDPLDSPV